MRLREGRRLPLVPSTSGTADAVSSSRLAQMRLMPVDRGSITGRVAVERRAVHVARHAGRPRIHADARHPSGDIRRTCLGVPLLRRAPLSGRSSLQRTEVQAIHAKSRSSWWRPSPTRPSSPSRTRGCSRRCRRARRELTEVARAPDGDRRGAGRHQPFAQRAAARARCDRRDRVRTVPLASRPHHAARRTTPIASSREPGSPCPSEITARMRDAHSGRPRLGVRPRRTRGPHDPRAGRPVRPGVHVHAQRWLATIAARSWGCRCCATARQPA